ncbi:MAG: hypothetical protein QGG71_25530 [Pirellulaceae bacterium]|jgi:hypothetical protein|nr:hypothetical protein [Pirellulaceae bacterium]
MFEKHFPKMIAVLVSLIFGLAVLIYSANKQLTPPSTIVHTAPAANTPPTTPAAPVAPRVEPTIVDRPQPKAEATIRSPVSRAPTSQPLRNNAKPPNRQPIAPIKAPPPETRVAIPSQQVEPPAAPQNDPRSNLAAAVKHHETRVGHLTDTLSDAFDGAIEDAADKRDVAAVKSLTNEKERFTVANELPTSSAMKSSRDEYVNDRRESAKDVVDEYKAMLELDDGSGDSRKSLAKFVDDERAATSLAPAEIAAPSPPASRPGTSEFLQRIVEELEDGLERISELPTTAAQDDEHRKLMDALDHRLQNSKLVFRFPIADVTESQKVRGRYDLSFSVPLEVKGLLNMSYLSESKDERMTKEEALRLDGGFVYEITGTGRLAVSTTSRTSITPNTQFIFSLKPPDSRNVYSFFVSRPKSRIIRDDSATTVIVD